MSSFNFQIFLMFALLAVLQGFLFPTYTANYDCYPYGGYGNYGGYNSGYGGYGNYGGYNSGYGGYNGGYGYNGYGYGK